MTDLKSAPPLTLEGMSIEPGLPLELGGEGIDDIRNSVQQLLDIEAIKQLKHAYFRCLDTVNWKELESLFHKDVTAHLVGGGYDWNISGVSEYVGMLRKSLNSRSIGQHTGHHPEIRILSKTEATGLWYLVDKTWILDAKYLASGTAIYRDRYLKEDGKWLIRETNYQRIFQKNRVLDNNPEFAVHYMGEYGEPPEKE
jgi:hypothetical protein